MLGVSMEAKVRREVNPHRIEQLHRMHRQAQQQQGGGKFQDSY